MQTALAWIIVLACASHALWLLMPAAARRALARRLGRPQPAPAQGGCSGCSGGCGPQATQRVTARPITLHRHPAGAAQPAGQGSGLGGDAAACQAADTR